MVRYVSNLLAMIPAFSLAGAARHATAHSVVLSQEAAVEPFQIAAPFPDETAFEIVGRTAHAVSSITSYGFLTYIASIDQSMVFADPGPASSARARFTYFARVERMEEPGSGDVPVVNAAGELTVYFSENGGATLDDVATFYQGTPIARFQVQIQEVLQLDQPGNGVIIGEGTQTQVIDTPFQFDGAGYRFGHAGLEERFLYTGTPLSEEMTSADFLASITGHATVASSEAHGEPIPGTPAAVTSQEATVSSGQTPTADAACEGAEAWFAEAVANAEQAEAIVAGFPVSVSLQSLDPIQVSNGAADLATLAESQRAAAVPEAGTSANRLLVTALSTYSLGATLVERAIEEQDEALLPEALDIIQSGNELTARALAQLEEVATLCEIEP